MARIRCCTPQDRAEWLRLRSTLWPDASPEELAAEIDAWPSFDEWPVFIAESEDGTVIGFAEGSIHAEAPGCSTNRIGFLEGWYVDEAYRRQGVGGALNSAVERWAREKGCTEMASDTTPEYPNSHAAHLALGYREAGDRYHFFKSL